MPTLNLIIADRDQLYLDNLVDFISLKYKNRFYVQSFSNEKTFAEYIERVEKVDILLICPQFYREDLQLKKIESLMVLSSGVVPEDIKDYVIINKYQTGDKLISNILNIFSEVSNHRVFTEDANNPCKVITFFSPCGGSGKSTLAIGTSVCCVQDNINAFYLNLERFPSTTLYFDSHGNNENFSSIMFYLKENNKNLPLKIEGCRSIDRTTGVHYFLPQENIFDIDDMTAEEVKSLIMQLKKMACYDTIVIDIGSELNDINVSVLEHSDLIILVLPDDMILAHRFGSFLKGLEILKKRRGINLIEKSELVINKCSDPSFLDRDDTVLSGKSIFSRIPTIKGLGIDFGMEYFTNPQTPMGSSIKQIVHKLKQLI
ncbi:MAG: hypothetical protein GX992_06585 [Clostridium sp.]|nr:hypothetical protein [Clostridium sp.]